MTVSDNVHTKRHIKTHLVKESELIDHFEELLGNMNQGLIFISSKGNVTTYNAAAEILLGLEEENVLNHPFLNNFSDDFLGFSLEKSLKEGFAPGQTVVPFESFLGIDRVMEVSPTVITSIKEKDTILGVMVLLRDVTEMHRLQKEEARSHRLKSLGELASYVAHEIRNPLGGIKGFCSLLDEDLEGDTEKKRLLKKIVDGVEDLNAIVSQVLDFSRPIELQKENVDLIPYLNNFVTMLSLDERVTKNTTIEFNTAVQECYLSIDPQKMHQVLYNLCLNAIQALPPEGGNVTLELKQAGKEVTLSVKDTGCGISSKSLEKIFEPFYTTKTEGNGFGLSQVHKVIEAEKGKIHVTSQKNIGTTFTITLYND